jgi:DNA-binding response OmpR family regulator
MRMLIADDDPALGAFLARGLEKDGHQVLLATDGEMAMEAASSDLPDMAVRNAHGLENALRRA